MQKCSILTNNITVFAKGMYRLLSVRRFMAAFRLMFSMTEKECLSLTVKLET